MNDHLSLRGTAAPDGARNPYLPPTVPAALEDIPGGQENLLPIDILDADLRVEFPRWDEAPEDRETLELYWNGVPVAEKSWPGPVPDNDLFILLPATQLRSGVHTLHYRVTNWMGNAADSEPITITVDTTEPFFPNNPGMPTFKTAAQIGGITQSYLDNNDNLVEVTLPDYDLQPGDRFEFHWEDGGPFGSNEIAADDMPADRKVFLDGDVIKAEGNGDKIASFYVYDRAGNRSKLSEGRSIKVNIAPPKLRPHPTVKDAQTGDPGLIDPSKITAGCIIQVPPQDDVPSSAVRVFWEGFGELGSYIVDAPELIGGWTFKVPPQAIPANFKRQVQVYYEVELATDDKELSEVYRLNVGNALTTKIGCAQSTGAAISLAAVPAAGADLNLPPWPFKDKTPGMRVNFWLTGIDPAGVPLRTEILEGVPVEINREPVTGKLPRAALLELKMNAVFRLHAAVSFDDGESYQDFQGLDLNLTA